MCSNWWLPIVKLCCWRSSHWLHNLWWRHHFYFLSNENKNKCRHCSSSRFFSSDGSMDIFTEQSTRRNYPFHSSGYEIIWWETDNFVQTPLNRYLSVNLSATSVQIIFCSLKENEKWLLLKVSTWNPRSITLQSYSKEMRCVQIFSIYGRSWVAIPSKF